MLIAGLSILDAIPVFVAALVGFLVVQGFGLIKLDQPEKKEDQGPTHKEQELYEILQTAALVFIGKVFRVRLISIHWTG